MLATVTDDVEEDLQRRDEFIIRAVLAVLLDLLLHVLVDEGDAVSEVIH